MRRYIAALLVLLAAAGCALAEGTDKELDVRNIKGNTLTIESTIRSDLIVHGEVKDAGTGEKADFDVLVHPPTKKVVAEPMEGPLYLAEGFDQAALVLRNEPEEALQYWTYTAANEKIATVDGQGVVHAVSPGKTTVTATAIDGSRRHAKIAVQVAVEVTGIAVSVKQTEVAPGKSLTLKASLTPEKPTEKGVEWSAACDPAMEEYVKISKTGQLTVRKGCPSGAVRVTARALGVLPGAEVTDTLEILVR